MSWEMTLRWTVLVIMGYGTSFGQGWLGQEQVSGSDTHSTHPVIAFEPMSGRPWVVWHGYWDGAALQYTRWLGDRWDEPHVVRPTPPGMVTRDNPDLAFSSEGQAWLVWSDMWPGITYDVGFSYWRDTCWAQEGQVNQPDSNDQDWMPRIACRGGQIWCAWDGGPYNSAPHRIYACRWDSAAGVWGPEMQVSPPDGNHHWLAAVKVDIRGAPHIVWCAQPQHVVLHSFYANGEWRGPFPVNDTTRVIAGSFAPLSIDRDGVMHLAFPGAWVGASTMDIFYSSNNGAGWTEPQPVTLDSTYSEWNCSIAARCTSDVWVVFTRQGPWADEFRVYATHYDGLGWSQEVRLDDDSAQEDFRPIVALDSGGSPWVVWYGRTDAPRDYHVYCNRYTANAVGEHARPGGDQHLLALAVASPVCRRLVAMCYLPNSEPATIQVFDAAGRQVASETINALAPGWYSLGLKSDLSAGAYVCRLSSAGQAVARRFVEVAR